MFTFWLSYVFGFVIGLVAVIMITTVTVEAQTTCTTVGDTTYCQTPKGPVTCTTVGGTTYCN